MLNTHIHGDHWLGNQAVRAAFPDAVIYGHPEMLAEVEGSGGGPGGPEGANVPGARVRLDDSPLMSGAVFELAADLMDVSSRAREGKLGPDDMAGGCISISSLGGIGGTQFTPIVNQRSCDHHPGSET